MSRDDPYPTPPDDLEDHDRGLSQDLPRLLGRRRVLSLFGGAGLVALAGCAADSDSSSGSSTGSTQANPGQGGPGGGPPGGGAESDVEVAENEIPEETAGPYPGDGSNGVNVLTQSGVVRSDITKSFGSAAGVAEGVPLTITLKVLDVSGESSSPLTGAAVYVWHCDRDGEYSLYSEGISGENYLRGVQETDASGSVTFRSIFPAAYSGRWPHVHFEIYPSLDEATSASGKLRTSQLALPEDVCTTVYATEGYEQSVRNLAQTSLEGDNVFSDGYSLQLAKVTGDAASGLTATLNVPV